MRKWSTIAKTNRNRNLPFVILLGVILAAWGCGEDDELGGEEAAVTEWA